MILMTNIFTFLLVQILKFHNDDNDNNNNNNNYYYYYSNDDDDDKTNDNFFLSEIFHGGELLEITQLLHNA
jgi:hypothetical protein